jgi:ferredoxin-NADP reductase
MGEIQGIITDVTKLTNRISQLTIASTDGAVFPEWTAGAHVEFNTPNGKRAYSLTPSDTLEHYKIAVQRDDDGQGGSTYMHTLTTGDGISFSAPKNDFPLDKNALAVLLAGGIGVTPLVSMALALKAENRSVSMIYAGRSRQEMAYISELQQALSDQLRMHFDDKHGRLDLNEVVNALDENAHLYVCGPRPMLDAIREDVETAGVNPEHIHFELFETASPQTGDTPFEVQINDGSVFKIPVGKTIIEVLEENDIDVMYDCQRGDCGICQCDVLEGVPDHRDVVLSEAERAAGDVMQICVSRAKSARLVLDIDGE